MPQLGQKLLQNSSDSWSQSSGSNPGSWYAEVLMLLEQAANSAPGAGSSTWTPADILQILNALSQIQVHLQGTHRRQPRYASLTGGASWDIDAQANPVLSVAIAWTQIDAANSFDLTDSGGTISETAPGRVEWGDVRNTTPLQGPLAVTANGSAIARIAWEEQV